MRAHTRTFMNHAVDLNFYFLFIWFVVVVATVLSSLISQNRAPIKSSKQVCD